MVRPNCSQGLVGFLPTQTVVASRVGALTARIASLLLAIHAPSKVPSGLFLVRPFHNPQLLHKRCKVTNHFSLSHHRCGTLCCIGPFWWFMMHA